MHCIITHLPEGYQTKAGIYVYLPFILSRLLWSAPNLSSNINGMQSANLEETNKSRLETHQLE